MRLGRQDASVLHPPTVPFQIGRMIRLREGHDLAVIATGNMVEQAVLAADVLAARGVSVRVLDCHTIKPIDVDEIVNAARQTKGIITAEDHNTTGGLGAAVCEVVAERSPARVLRVGLQDRFASSARDYRRLLSHYGLDSQTIVRRAEELLRPC
jgi:transketolase